MNVDRILQGDCCEVLQTYPDNFFDSIVTDPPYELAFMGKKWDASGIAYDAKVWSECLRVLKPGGHLLAFGGTRTYHRMACAIEDAGFEIRDMIEWVYGSGFPKSLDISKAIDKAAGAEREVIGKAKGTGKQNPAWNGTLAGRKENSLKPEYDLTVPSTPAAKQWAGFGTALKPAHEPIVLARQPLDEATIAANVLKWGCGGLNVDGCRIGTDEECRRSVAGFAAKSNIFNNDEKYKINTFETSDPKGRFPANLIHDGSPVVLAEFGKAGESKSTASKRGNLADIRGNKYNDHKGHIENSDYIRGHSDSGTPSRFFQACEWGPEDVPAFVYEAKASRGEREKGLDGMPARIRDGNNGIDRGIGICTGCGLTFNGSNDHSKCVGERIDTPLRAAKNNHPTVKPLSLMRYLCRLITPPGGLILDPFAGSGTTLLAARQENMHYIGIELQSEYVAIARKRLAAVPVSLDSFF
jgi:DNA modification methylase